MTKPWYSKMPVWAWIVSGLGLLGALCCAGLGVVAVLSPAQPQAAAPSQATPATTAPPTPLAPESTPVPTVLTAVPGLPPEAATKLGLVTAELVDFHGLEAYNLTLATGQGWAIKGTPEVVLPLAAGDPTYNENAAIFLRSGPYVLYFPSTPEALYVAPFPGMTVVDADEYL